MLIRETSLRSSKMKEANIYIYEERKGSRDEQRRHEKKKMYTFSLARSGKEEVRNVVRNGSCYTISSSVSLSH